MNAEDMAEYWLLFQKILHQIPVPTWRLTAFWNSCSKGSDFSSILCGHSMHKVHRHTCRLNSHTHKTKIKKHLWNKLPLWDHNVFIFLKLFYFIFQYPRFMLLIRCANTTLKLVTIWFITFWFKLVFVVFQFSVWNSLPLFSPSVIVTLIAFSSFLEISHQ